MSIVGLYGHSTLRQRLREAQAREALPASLLFHGPRGVGKQRLALWMGQVLLCTASPDARPCEHCQSCRFVSRLTHPDLHWYFPRPRLKDGDPSPAEVNADYAEAIADRVEADGLYAAPPGDEGIYIATVRAIVQSAALSPAIGARKVYVVGDAERMVSQTGADQAANAFLKLLEEPPANTTVILTSSEPGALLPTIRSRVAALRVAPLPADDVRRFTADPLVRPRVTKAHGSLPVEDLIALASGAPGRLFAHDAWADAMTSARALVDAARSQDASAAIKAAFLQGGSKARGRFSDTLDAITAVLHADARSAAGTSDADRARRAAMGVDVVERAKELAAGNVNPQLIMSSLLRDLAPLVR